MALATSREESAGRRTLQLDAVAFRISEIDGRPLPVGAEARFLLAAVIAIGGEMLPDRHGIERLDAQADVIQVGAASGLLARRRACLTGRDDVDGCAPGAQ